MKQKKHTINETKIVLVRIAATFVLLIALGFVTFATSLIIIGIVSALDIWQLLALLMVVAIGYTTCKGVS